MREWESRLGAASVNLAGWDRYLKRIGEQGIEINTVAELESDPKRDRRLYELERQVDREVPGAEPPTKVPFEEFQKVWGRTNLVPDGWFVPLDNDEYVAMTNLWSSQAAANILYVGLTGVIRSHRRRGFAIALKLRAVEFARKQGIAEIRTENASNNERMLTINNRLGFVRQPGNIYFVKEMRDERPEDAELTIIDRVVEQPAPAGAATE